ncbi:MAG: hypothetical protein ACREV2_15360, partial [Burkholderiales bacterium]
SIRATVSQGCDKLSRDAVSHVRQNFARLACRRSDEKTCPATIAAGSIHVVYLRNADAVAIAEILRGIFSGDQKGVLSLASSTGAPAAAAPAARTPGSPAHTSGSRSAAGFSREHLRGNNAECAV